MIDAKCQRLVATAQESDAEMMFAKKYFHWRRVRQIRSLYGADEAFRAVWEDYRLTNRALRHFKALGEAGVIRANEYRLMRDELVEEVLYHLKGAFK
jgi:hypothetical protein